MFYLDINNPYVGDLVKHIMLTDSGGFSTFF